jgi:hypothetical protein
MAVLPVSIKDLRADALLVPTLSVIKIIRAP